MLSFPYTRAVEITLGPPGKTHKYAIHDGIASKSQVISSKMYKHTQEQSKLDTLQWAYDEVNKFDLFMSDEGLSSKGATLLERQHQAVHACFCQFAKTFDSIDADVKGLLCHVFDVDMDELSEQYQNLCCDRWRPVEPTYTASTMYSVIARARDIFGSALDAQRSICFTAARYDKDLHFPVLGYLSRDYEMFIRALYEKRISHTQSIKGPETKIHLSGYVQLWTLSKELGFEEVAELTVSEIRNKMTTIDAPIGELNKIQRWRYEHEVCLGPAWKDSGLEKIMSGLAGMSMAEWVPQIPQW